MTIFNIPSSFLLKYTGSASGAFLMKYNEEHGIYQISHIFKLY
jgi:hypothetical protein